MSDYISVISTGLEPFSQPGVAQVSERVKKCAVLPQSTPRVLSVFFSAVLAVSAVNSSSHGLTERSQQAAYELEEHDRRQRYEHPVALERVLTHRDDDASHGRRHQDYQAHVEQQASGARSATEHREPQADRETRRARRHPNVEHAPDGPIESTVVTGNHLRTPDRYPRLGMHITTATTTRTAAISSLSHLTGALSPIRRPLHDPTCTPSTAAAAKDGIS